MIAISNTRPLILLDKINLLSVLGKMFETVHIPTAVDKEWLRPGGYKTPSWIIVDRLSLQAMHMAKNLCKKIDLGEAQAIALYASSKADVLLLDDLNGRKLAKAMRIPVAGTLGILIAAKKRGLITELFPAIEKLKQNRYFISEDAIQKALHLAGEL